MSLPPPLVLEGLGVRLGRRQVLGEVSATFTQGAFTALCGPNGAGKTTLLRAALGLVAPETGAVRLFGDDPRRISPGLRADRIAYLAQDRRVAWGMSAVSVAALGAIRAAPDLAEARARAVLERVGMAALAERSLFEMSGGERARVLLARLLAARAPVLVLDEPVAGLDPEAQLLTLDILREEAERGATVIAALHDLDLCARFADRVVVLDAGRLVADGCFQDALCSEVLRHVFRLDGKWIETGSGWRLASTRLKAS